MLAKPIKKALFLEVDSNSRNSLHIGKSCKPLWRTSGANPCQLRVPPRAGLRGAGLFIPGEDTQWLEVMKGEEGKRVPPK